MSAGRCFACSLFLLAALPACRDNRVVVRQFEDAYCAMGGDPVKELGTLDEGAEFVPLSGEPQVLPVFSSWLAMSSPLALRLRGIPPENARVLIGWDLDGQGIDEVAFDVDLLCAADQTPEPVVYTLSIGEQYGTAEDYAEPVEGFLRVRAAAAGTDPATCTEDGPACLVVDEPVQYLLATSE